MGELWRLTREEQADVERDGYLLRPGVFTRDETDAMARSCEYLIDQLVRDREGNRVQMGSYVFDPDLLRGVTIKWEGDTDVVHGIEPVVHLSPELHEWALDRRLVEPAKDFTGDDAPALFTEKLNLKRPRHGGANPLHQDYPYWEGVAGAIEHVVTAIVFLDDATLENGCLEVIPGSHRDGKWQTRTDGDYFASNEIDRTLAEAARAVPVPASAGDVLFFGPYLVHQSAPNTSDLPRRALLFSYQPPGHWHMLDFLRRMAESTAPA
jgi:hypothetical protein